MNGTRIRINLGQKQEGNWIEVEEKKPGIFTVMDDNITVKDGDRVTEDVTLGFSEWDDEVEDLDGDEDSQMCNISEHLKWQDVDLTPEEYHAPSIERLKEALSHVTICAFCPGDP
jgi:hypothetical protein